MTLTNHNRVSLADNLLFAEIAVHALCRLERLERVRCFLTDARSAVWDAYRGDLQLTDLVDMCLRDQAVPFPSVFSIADVVPGSGPGDIRCFSSAALQEWIKAERRRPDQTPRGFLSWAADKLLPSGPRWGEPVPTMARNQLAMELPGTGGLLAYRVITEGGGVYLQDNFLIACADWRERLFAGLVALELQVSVDLSQTVVVDSELDGSTIRDRRYHLIVGSSARYGSILPALRELLAVGGQVALL